MMEKGFTLLEVIFAVSFLVLLGMAIISLDLVGLKMMNESELKTVAYGLHDEARGFVKLCLKEPTINGCEGVNGKKTELKNAQDIITFNVNCPFVDATPENCTLSENETSIVSVGTSKLKYARTAKISRADTVSSTPYTVIIKTEWGNGDRNNITTTELIGGNL